MTLTNIELLCRLDALAHVSPKQARIIARLGPEGETPLYAFVFGDVSQPAVLAAAGIHGDEPEGVATLLDWLAVLCAGDAGQWPFPLIVLPCVNPTGLRLETRTNSAGQDINRQFHADSTPETIAVRRVLSGQSLFAIVDLHTDTRAQGFYFFELLQAQTEGVAGALLDELKSQGIALEPRPSYAGFVGREGVLAPSPERIARFGRDAPGQGLGDWGWQRAVRRCYVLETPRAPGMAASIRWQAGALQDLLKLLAPLAAHPTQRTLVRP